MKAFAKNKINAILILVVIVTGVQCTEHKDVTEKQPVKIDFDFAGRKPGEVHYPESASWIIGDETRAEKEIEGLIIRLEGDLSSSWYKAGIQKGGESLLINDGLRTGNSLTLTISGLKEGEHSLLTFHNTFDSPEATKFRPVKIYVNEELRETVTPSNREIKIVDAAMAFIKFKARKGENVVFRFETDEASGISNENLVINGLEIDMPNKMKQAYAPEPANNDLHVPGESHELRWNAPETKMTYDVYFGEDEKTVAGATRKSPEYKGEIKENSFRTEKLYSMQTYFWRVDVIEENGEITPGTVWSFRPAQLAFPGAEGYGRYAIGGRGGKVVEVTNLNDSGPGSLREAVTSEIGPRTIVFNVSGNIELKSRLVVNQPYITIAGQTAPGKGITISRAPIGLTGDDGIIRFLRVRIGAGRTYDGMGLTGANHSIIDHCSISWTLDEGFSSRGAHNITLQRTLISEALNVAGHSKYEKGKMHGYAASIGGDIGSFHHNLLAHNYGRNWSIAGGINGDGYYTGRLDIRNNVVYNWGHRATDGGANQVNFVGNYYKPGPSTNFFYALNAQHEGVGLGKQQYFFDKNVMTGYFDESNQEKGRTISISGPAQVDYETYLDKPFFESYVKTHAARQAYKNVLSDVGTNQSQQDEYDKRIIKETRDSTYTYKGSKSGLPGTIDTEEDAGGWENYPEEKRPGDWDTDHDGLPDWWEKARGLNPDSVKGDFTDTNTDEDKDGYTELGEYLDWMARPHYFVNTETQTALSGKELFAGYQNQPEYTILQKENVSVSVTGDEIIFKSSKKGFMYFDVQVKDASGDTMIRRVNAFSME
ncbi:pectate lyase family protein [Sinomicrobium sp. M5D2P9]